MLADGRVLPADGATGEVYAYVKAASWPRLAIHDLSQLRKLTRRSKKGFFPGLPETLCHQASAVRADVSRDGTFQRTRRRGLCEVDRDNHRGAPLYSSVEVPFTKTKRGSTRIHGWLKSPFESSLPSFSHNLDNIWLQRKQLGKRPQSMAGYSLSTV